MSPVQRRKDKRRETRQLCSDLVEVSFHDQAGKRVSETGLVEDVSSRGLCVSLSLPLPVGCSVEISSGSFSGKAEVRYCNLGDYSYLIGMEFAEGSEWDHRTWTPKHLLSLPDLDSG